MDDGIKEIIDIPFNCDSIAVVGASDDPFSFGHHYVRHLLDYGYPGRIYPVNPNRQTILGLKAYPTLSSIPAQVEYVICCISASRVLDLITECSSLGIKIVQFFTARLSETGRQEAKDLETKIRQHAKKLDVRLIGPNCMGVYCPRRGMAFNFDFPKEPGTVGAVYQSAAAFTLLARYAELQGIRFSKVISYGNALDLDESDFLLYLAQDSETKVIATYIEGVKNGRKFLDTLSEIAQIKPVIVLKGGRSMAGGRAIASHTASIAGSHDAWDTACRQAGVIQARDVSELISLLVTFSFLPPIEGRRVAILGGGGGRGVMSADACEEAGLSVPPLGDDVRNGLKTEMPELWDWLGNPMDFSIMTAKELMNCGNILRMVAKSPLFNLVIANVNEDAPLARDSWEAFINKETDDIIEVFNEQLKPMIVIVSDGKINTTKFQDWRWKLLAEQRARLVAANIPTYSRITDAANAIRKFADYWQAPSVS